MEENNITVDKAVQTIKGAILRAQAQASQSGNAIQLSLYYGIGRYVSINLQQAHWGAKALDTISERLQPSHENLFVQPLQYLTVGQKTSLIEI